MTDTTKAMLFAALAGFGAAGCVFGLFAARATEAAKARADEEISKASREALHYAYLYSTLARGAGWAGWQIAEFDSGMRKPASLPPSEINPGDEFSYVTFADGHSEVAVFRPVGAERYRMRAPLAVMLDGKLIDNPLLGNVWTQKQLDYNNEAYGVSHPRSAPTPSP